jgi:hypothetical protein
MKIILLGLSVTLLTSCGNPHISSSRGGLERTNAPLVSEPDPLCSPEVQTTEYELFLQGQSDKVPARLNDLNKCKKTVIETFASMSEGETNITTNEDFIEESYVLRHQSEHQRFDGKVIYLDDYFGAEIFPMNIETPVVVNGKQGKDKGLDSLNAEEDLKDALIWSFSSPVSSFTVNLVGLKTSSTLRIFDCDSTLVKEYKIAAGPAFVGLVAPSATVCHVSLTSGSVSESIGVDDFSYSL